MFPSTPIILVIVSNIFIQCERGLTDFSLKKSILICKSIVSPSLIFKSVSVFLSSFISSSPQVRNNISTEIVRYAASNTDVSSFFVKVF